MKRTLLTTTILAVLSVAAFVFSVPILAHVTHPVIETYEAEFPDYYPAHTAVFVGEIVSMGGFAEVYFRWEWRELGETVWQTVPVEGAVVEWWTYYEPTEISYAMWDKFALNTTYEYRAVGTGDHTTYIYGTTREFTTGDTLHPYVYTLFPDDVTDTSAKLKGSLIELGEFEEVEVRFYLREFGETWEAVGSSLADTTGTYVFFATDLSPYTVYEFEFRASGDWIHWSPGGVRQFTTDYPPDVDPPPPPHPEEGLLAKLDEFLEDMGFITTTDKTFFSLGLIGVGATVAYVSSRSLVVTMCAMIALVVVGTLLGYIPIWITVAITAIIAIALAMKFMRGTGTRESE